VLVSDSAIPKKKKAGILCVTILQTQENSEHLRISINIPLVTSIVSVTTASYFHNPLSGGKIK